MSIIAKRQIPRWLIVALLCLCVRGVFMLFVRAEPIADFAFYFTRAAELASGLGYRFQGHPTAFFPVGTSLLLAGPFALFGPSLGLAEILSLVAWTSTTVLVYKIGSLVVDEKTGFIAAAIVALHPDLVAFSALVASENFFIPLLLSCVYSMCLGMQMPRLSLRLALTAGGLFGLALLVRSTALLLLPLFALLILLDRRGLQRGLLMALTFCAATAVVLLPWVARNAVSMGKPLLTTNGGISLWWGNNPHASGGFPLSMPLPTQDLSSVEAEVANNARFSAAAFSFIEERPIEWLSLAPSKLRFLFAAPSPDIGFSLRNRYVAGPWAIESHPRLGNAATVSDAAYVERELGPVESRMIGAYYHLAGGVNGLVLQGGLWLVGTVGFALLWLRESHHRRQAAVLFLTPLAWVVFHVTLGNGQPRYLLSVAPLVAVGAAYAVTALLSRRRGRQYSTSA